MKTKSPMPMFLLGGICVAVVVLLSYSIPHIQHQLSQTAQFLLLPSSDMRVRRGKARGLLEQALALLFSLRWVAGDGS